MATLFDAIRSSFVDQWWLFKLICSVYVLYFTIYKAEQYIPSPELRNIFYLIIFLFFLGCSAVSIKRNLNNQHPLFPGITNAIEVVSMAIGGFISILIGSIVSAIFVWFMESFLIPLFPSDNLVIKYVFDCLALLFAFPFIIIPLILYCKDGKLSDAFKFEVISQTAGAYFTAILNVLVQFLCIYGLAYVCLYFLLIQMFGKVDLFINVLNCTIIVVAFFTTMVCLSENYDLRIKNDIEEIIKKT